MTDPQVDHSGCAAAGCNMLGTNSRSTTGSNEWYCSIHFGSPAKDWRNITDELNRLAWLVDVVRGLRALPIKKNLATFEGDAAKAIALCQRGDLQCGPRESTEQWMIRLEGVLAYSCREAAQVDRMERAEVARAAP